MASHDLINTKPTILRATLGAIPGIAAKTTRKIFICPCILGAFFQELGWSPAHQSFGPCSTLGLSHMHLKSGDRPLCMTSLLMQLQWALRKGPPFFMVAKLRGDRNQNGSGQMGGRDVEEPLVYPYPKNRKTQTMVCVSLPRDSDHGLSFSFPW